MTQVGWVKDHLLNLLNQRGVISEMKGRAATNQVVKTKNDDYCEVKTRMVQGSICD